MTYNDSYSQRERNEDQIEYYNLTAGVERFAEITPKQTHTKGPWKRWVNIVTRNVEIEKDGKTIATVKFTGSAKETELNSRLIEMAPKLLEICRDMDSGISRFLYHPKICDCLTCSFRADVGDLLKDMSGI